jgi:hypothetical protein
MPFSTEIGDDRDLSPHSLNAENGHLGQICIVNQAEIELSQISAISRASEMIVSQLNFGDQIPYEVVIMLSA